MFSDLQKFQMKDGLVLYQPCFLSDADLLFNYVSQLDYEQEYLIINNAKIACPRKTCYFGDYSYTYSGIKKQSRQMPELIRILANQIDNFVSQNFDLYTNFNSCLLNYYTNGSDNIGFHSDDEPALGDDPVVACISLGCERSLVFKSKKHSETLSLNLEHGSLIVMGPRVQENYKHALPKVKSMDARISLTFRHMLEKK